MPASIVAGRLLMANIATRVNSPSIAVSGWTALGIVVNGINSTLATFVKTAAGSDTGSVTGSSGSQVSALTYQIDGWSGVLGNVGYAQVSATLDPPSLTMPAAADYLWLPAVGCLNLVPSAAPTNYSNLLTASNTPIFLGSARRTLNASSEDPGAFTGSGTSPVAATIAVPPVAAAASTSFLQTPLVPRLRSYNW
jgi:hypothetical protein